MLGDPSVKLGFRRAVGARCRTILHGGGVKYTIAGQCAQCAAILLPERREAGICSRCKPVLPKVSEPATVEDWRTWTESYCGDLIEPYGPYGDDIVATWECASGLGKPSIPDDGQDPAREHPTKRKDRAAQKQRLDAMEDRDRKYGTGINESPHHTPARLPESLTFVIAFGNCDRIWESNEELHDGL